MNLQKLVALAKRRDITYKEDANRFSNALSLKQYDYKLMADDVERVRQYPSVGHGDLVSAGLIRNAELHHKQIQYHDRNKFTAQTSMNGSNRQSQENDYMPKQAIQPIHHSDWKIQWRDEGLSYLNSEGSIEAMDAVMRERDSAIFTGRELGAEIDGTIVQAYGYLNHPNTIAGPTISDWTNPANYDNIYTDALAMQAALTTASKIIGGNSVVMYVSDDFDAVLDVDYSTQKGDLTARQRILSLSKIGRVEMSPYLPPKSALLVHMDPRSVLYYQSSDIINVPHTRIDPMDDMEFTAMAAGALVIKTDRNNVSGILYSTTS